MITPISILIVEDEVIVAADLQEALEREGYRVVGNAVSGDEAIRILRTTDVDLMLLDVNIKGDIDGIDTACQIRKIKNIPFIYLTAYADRATLDRAKQTYPSAYLTKPFQIVDVQIAIDLAFQNFQLQKANSLSGTTQDVSIANELGKVKTEGDEGKEHYSIIQGALFIRHNQKYVKVMISDIVYLLADSNHIHVHTRLNVYLLRRSLQSLMDELPAGSLVRVHRSYAINASFITQIKENQIYLGDVQVPIGRSYKEAFIKGIKLL